MGLRSKYSLVKLSLWLILRVVPSICPAKSLLTGLNLEASKVLTHRNLDPGKGMKFLYKALQAAVQSRLQQSLI